MEALLLYNTGTYLSISKEKNYPVFWVRSTVERGEKILIFSFNFISTANFPASIKGWVGGAWGDGGG